MSGDMGQHGIRTTGQPEIDTATAEIALAVRDYLGPGRTEQAYYDEATRLRDEICRGERARVVAGLRALAATDPHWFTDRFAAHALADLIEAGEVEAGVLPATATPSVITDDIALNMAAGVLEAHGRPATADMLRRMLPAAEGKIYGQPYQEATGKWGPIAREAS
jgi:hypothetical protein